MTPRASRVPLIRWPKGVEAVRYENLAAPNNYSTCTYFVHLERQDRSYAMTAWQIIRSLHYVWQHPAYFRPIVPSSMRLTCSGDEQRTMSLVSW